MVLPPGIKASGDRGCPSVLSRRQVGKITMRRTIGLTAYSSRAAEVKTDFVNLPQRPAAQSRSQPLQSVDILVIRLSRSRRPAPGQLEAKDLADDRVLRNAHSATDFARADPCVPQADERRRPFRSPFLCHWLRIPCNFGKERAPRPFAIRTEKIVRAVCYEIFLTRHTKN